jgi:large subunit ribosomal protein L6
MSRIGKKLINLPESVSVNVLNGEVLVKGSKGELHLSIPTGVDISVDEQARTIKVDVKDSDESALWGTTRANIANMVIGVSTGWSRALELQGVGFRMELKGKKLVMRLGFSHEVEYELPEGIDAKIDGAIMTISGINRQLVGQVASEIRSLKKPEPYKGKGFRYTDETIRRKAGKAAKSE